MAKKKSVEVEPGFISLRLVEPNSETARPLLEGVPSDTIKVNNSVILKDGKSLVSTGIILVVVKTPAGELHTVKTKEGYYEVHKTRAL